MLTPLLPFLPQLRFRLQRRLLLQLLRLHLRRCPLQCQRPRRLLPRLHQLRHPSLRPHQLRLQLPHLLRHQLQ